MKTFSPKPVDTHRSWHLIDAKDQVLGRLSTRLAVILMGKHRPTFSRHLDMGDHIVVVNADLVKVTGRKELQKLYHRHSGYPGGMKVFSLSQVRATHPERILIHAVTGMLPKNKLQAKMLKHLHVYPGLDHPYTQHFNNKSANNKLEN